MKKHWIVIKICALPLWRNKSDLRRTKIWLSKLFMGFTNHVHHHPRNLKVVLAGAFASIYNSLFDCYPLIACCLMQTRYCFLLMQSDQGMIVPISRKSYCPCIYSLLEHRVINLIGSAFAQFCLCLCTRHRLPWSEMALSRWSRRVIWKNIE